MDKLKKTKIFISIILFGIAVALAQFVFVPSLFAEQTKSGTPFVIEKNEIESVELFTYDSTQLKVGESATLRVKANPTAANLTIENIKFYIIRGKDYGQIKDNKLVVFQDALIGAKIEVEAEVDSVISSNTLVFSVVETPLDEIVIQNESDTLFQGEKAKLIAKCVPDFATNKSLVYDVVDGADYCKVLLDGTICVDSNLPRGDLKATIRVSSLQDASIYAEKTFNLYKPVTSISSFNKSLKNVEQKRSYNFSAKAEPRTATNASKKIVYTLNVSKDIATINDSGLLKISDSAPIGTKITIRMEAADDVSYEQVVEVVPVYATSFAVTSMTTPSHGEKYLPGDVIAINAEFLSPFNVTEINKKYDLKVSDETLATVSGHSVVISKEITKENPHFSVTAYTNQNGVILSQEIEIYVYIPVQKIEASQLLTTLKEGTSYDIKDLISAEILPQNSEIKDVKFEISSNDYATILGDKLIVKNDLPSGDLKIEVFVSADDVSSDIFVFDLYKPVQDIKLDNADLKEVEQQKSYSFCANVYPFNATFGDKPVTYSLDVSEDIATIDENGMLTISATAPIGTKIKIRIDATDGVFHEQTVEVVPVYATSFAVTDYTKPTHGTKYLPNDEIEFVAEFLSPFNITECNKVYDVAVSDESLAEVCGHVVKIKSIEQITKENPRFVVTVSTNQNGLILSETFEIAIYIPVTQINIKQKIQTLYENYAYDIADLVEIEILPSNCESKEIEYILSKQSNVILSNKNLVVKDNLSSGDLTFSLQARAEGVESEIVTFNLYKPVREIIIENNDIKEVEQQREYCFEGVSSPANATLGGTQVVYSLNVEQEIATIDEQGTLKISATAPIGTKIKIRFDAPDGVFYEKVVEVVPVYATSFAVTDMTRPTHGTKYLPNDEIAFSVEFLSPFNVTESNKVYDISISDNTLAEVVGKVVKIKSIQEITIDNPHFVVTISTNQNGVILSETREVLIYIPVTQIEVVQTKTTLNENKEYSLKSLLDIKIHPANCEIKTYEIELTKTNFASIFDDKLRIFDNLPSGDLTIELKVKSDGVCSNKLVFGIYKPTRFINIVADNSNPISAILYGEKVNLKITGSETASVLNPVITIIKGAELIEGSYKNGDQIGLSFAVKNNLCSVDNLNKQITIKATQDGLSKVIDLFVYIPNEQITININNLQRGDNIYTLNHTPNADDTRWVIVSKPDCVTSMEMGHIYIDQKTTAGTIVKIVYKSKDKLAKQFEAKFVVGGLNQVESEVVFVSSGANCDSSKFNIIVDKDSENVPITQKKHQLFVGRSTIIQVKYKGLPLKEYGLEIIFCKITNGLASIEKLDDGYYEISLSKDELGILGASSPGISISFSVKDGRDVFELKIENIFRAFRPMSGVPEFGKISEIEGYIPDLVGGDFDQTASYLIGDLKWEGEQANQSKITEYGYLTLTPEKSSWTQRFVISCKQDYNGTTIEYRQKINIYLKTLQLNHNDGTSGTSEIVVIPTFQSKVEVPKRAGWQFDGYYNTELTTFDLNPPSGSPIVVPQQIIDESGNVDFNGNVKALTAHWSPILYRLRIQSAVGNDTYTSSELFGTVSYNFQTYQFNFSHQTGEPGHIDIGNYPYGSSLDFDYYQKDGTDLGKEFSVYNWAEKSGDIVQILGCKYNSTCIATGTMITLFDGTQKAVEDLDGTEKLLVWNLYSGKFDSAPILFIDSHGEDFYKVLKLNFDDGTSVDVIDEHGFWDYNEKRYVYITNNNAAAYVGHYFDKEFVDENGHLCHKKVKFIDFEIVEEHTNAWSPVTYEHLCYYVNGMLSVPSETEGFTNIFEVDESMKYDEAKLQEDIEKYGLFDYEQDFKDLIPQQIFEAFGGKYLKVSLAKGYITFEQIEHLIQRYSKYFEMEGMNG